MILITNLASITHHDTPAKASRQARRRPSALRAPR
jgi:hypothetical protein